jgi:hypothetical protein
MGDTGLLGLSDTLSHFCGEFWTDLVVGYLQDAARGATMQRCLIEEINASTKRGTITIPDRSSQQCLHASTVHLIPSPMPHPSAAALYVNDQLRRRVYSLGVEILELKHQVVVLRALADVVVTD